MKISRREMLQYSGVLAAPYFGTFQNINGFLLEDVKEEPKDIMKRAVEVATGRGASYADARLTLNHGMVVRASNPPSREAAMCFGVRVLVDGYWGFASSPVWTAVEAERLAISALEQAASNAGGGERIVDMAPLDNPESGEWDMPVVYDPFLIPTEEISDYLYGIREFCSSLKWMKGEMVCTFMTMDKHFHSSTGQYTRQKLYATGGGFNGSVANTVIKRHAAVNIGDKITPAGLGFEYFRNRPIRQYIEEAHEDALRDLELPINPVDIGRWNILIGSWGMSGLVSETLGEATQLDRSLGFEANSGGTSYINEPLDMLGTLKIGNELLKVSSDRSEAGSVGKVLWDDEGVAPRKMSLVEKGILKNMHTSRELCSYIQPYYSRNGLKLEPSGSVGAQSAINVPLIYSSDLTLHPGEESSKSLNDLRQDMKSGIEFKTAGVQMDFQKITGYIRGHTYKIENGKRTAILADTGLIFRTQELWNNLIALGGNDSVSKYGITTRKGEPSQTFRHQVSTPPSLFKELSIIDITRKA